MIDVGSAHSCEDRELSFQETRDASSWTAKRGQPLASLGASHLRERFYCWRGVSGRRYICSVFNWADSAVVSEFGGAAIIGVMNDGATRRPVCVMSSGDFRLSENEQQHCFSRAHDVNEWHIHFGVDEFALRDLARSLHH